MTPDEIARLLALTEARVKWLTKRNRAWKENARLHRTQAKWNLISALRDEARVKELEEEAVRYEKGLGNSDCAIKDYYARWQKAETRVLLLGRVLRNLLSHEVYTYEGNLEARITVPQDAIDEAREALGEEI